MARRVTNDLPVPGQPVIKTFLPRKMLTKADSCAASKSCRSRSAHAPVTAKRLQIDIMFTMHTSVNDSQIVFRTSALRWSSCSLVCAWGRLCVWGICTESAQESRLLATPTVGFVIMTSHYQIHAPIVVGDYVLGRRIVHSIRCTAKNKASRRYM